MPSCCVKFFNTVLSSDGHAFRTLQRTINVDHAQSAEEAARIAQARFETSSRSQTGDCMRILARSILRIENEDLERNDTSADSHPASVIPCSYISGPCSIRIIPCFTE